MRPRIVPAILALSIVSTFCLAVAWKLGGEQRFSAFWGLPYDEAFETAERWRFVWTATGFAALSLVAPTALLLIMFRKLQQAYSAVVQSGHRAEVASRVDPLTGLPNRRVFFEELNRLKAKVANGAVLAVMSIDLDRFKPVNDLYGHAVGDKALKMVADRLNTLGRSGAIICRLGGDEFGAVLPARASDYPAEFARQILRALSDPMVISERRLEIGATIGIALYPEDGITADGLLHAADLAMYKAKHERRGAVRFFKPEMDAEMLARASVEANLREAIQTGEIRPHFHPLVCLNDGRLTGFEVLARWYRPDGSIIAPVDFIPVAEESGLIADLSVSLLRQACASARKWPEHLHLSVNIAACQLQDRHFPTQLLSLLAELRFPASRLEIEITESALIGNLEIVRFALAILKGAGAKIALDDFGTGYSSFGHLRDLPFDKVKIDRSFIQSMQSSPENAKIVAAMINLCNSLGLPVTAEGIETTSLRDSVRSIGCMFGQGYLYGKPIPGEAVDELIRAHNLPSVSEVVRFPRLGRL